MRKSSLEGAVLAKLSNSQRSKILGHFHFGTRECNIQELAKTCTV